jgi:hypothetical protein
MNTVVKTKPLVPSIDEAAKRLLRGSTKTSFWGSVTLDTNRVFVSDAAAKLSLDSLRATLDKHR